MATDPKAAPLADDLKELALYARNDISTPSHTDFHSSLPTSVFPKAFFCALCSELAIDAYKLLCCNKAICTPCMYKLATVHMLQWLIDDRSSKAFVPYHLPVMRPLAARSRLVYAKQGATQYYARMAAETKEERRSEGSCTSRYASSRDDTCRDRGTI
jgi:hypothetical protein